MDSPDHIRAMSIGLTRSSDQEFNDYLNSIESKNTKLKMNLKFL